jgi:hypothetical protein
VIIPKYFSNVEDIVFKEGKWEDWIYRERFWLSTCIFTIVLLIVAHHLHAHAALLNSALRVMLFVAGILSWTGI